MPVDRGDEAASRKERRVVVNELSSIRQPSLQDHVLWRACAALVGILPATGAAYGARSVLVFFRSLAVAGSVGAGTVAAGLYEANRPVLILTLAGTLFAAVLSAAWLAKPEKSRDFPCVLLSALAVWVACVPILLLWRAETLTIDVTAGRVAMSVSEASTQLSFLLLAGSFGSLILLVLLLVAAGFFIVWGRPLLATTPRLNAAVWIVATFLLATLAYLLYARSSYLQAVTLRGRF
jgi:hypothetical protein